MDEKIIKKMKILKKIKNMNNRIKSRINNQNKKYGIRIKIIN